MFFGIFFQTSSNNTRLKIILFIGLWAKRKLTGTNPRLITVRFAHLVVRGEIRQEIYSIARRFIPRDTRRERETRSEYIRGVSQYFPFNKTGKYIGTFSIQFNELSEQTYTTTRETRRCVSREINKTGLTARSRINAKSISTFPPSVNAAVIVNHSTVHRRIRLRFILSCAILRTICGVCNTFIARDTMRVIVLFSYRCESGARL